MAHGAHISDDEQEPETGEGGAEDGEEPLSMDATATGPMMSTPVLVPVRQQEEDVWESEGVRRRGVEEGEEGEEEGKWGAVAGKIDPDNLLKG